MLLARSLAVAIGSALLFANVRTAVAQDEVAGKPFVTMPFLMESISKSKTPSEAISAYAQAFAATGGDSMTERAFMVRMVDFGMPEMAEKQAEDLAIRTSDGLPYAVMAFSSARADKLDQAVLQIESAVRAAPNDVFVARTAGQVLAWYDVRKASVNFAEPVQVAAEDVRDRLQNRRAFLQAYKEVHDPIEAIYSGGEQGSAIVLANTDLATLGAFSGSNQSGFSSPMALFYTAPYALFPSYNYWYQPMGADVYYYQNWWQRGVGAGRLFPFPSIDRDTRFMKLSDGGFALVSDRGTSLYQPLGGGSIWSPGYYGGYGDYYGNYFSGFYNGGFTGFAGFGGGGLLFQGRPSLGRFAGGNSRVGQSRLSQRMNTLPPNLSSRNDFRVGSSQNNFSVSGRRLGGR